MSSTTAPFKRLPYNLMSFEGDATVARIPTPKSVRVTATPLDKHYRMSATDVIASVSGKSKNDASGTWLRLLRLDAQAKEELEPFMVMGQFCGPGEKIQPLLSLTGVLRLLMLLNGRAVAHYRVAFADALVHKLAKYGGGLAPIVDLDDDQRALLQQMARDDVSLMDAMRKRKRVEAPATPGLDGEEEEEEDAGDGAGCTELSLLDERLLAEFNQLSRQWAEEDRAAVEAAADGRVFGYCYLAWNPCLPPGMYKIGATAATPYERLRSLSRTSVPEDFQLLACFACWNPFQVEKRIHAHFVSSRKYGERKEFFVAPRAALIAYFNQLALEALSGAQPQPTAAGGGKKKRASVRSELAAMREQLQGMSAALSAVAAAAPK